MEDGESETTLTEEVSAVNGSGKSSTVKQLLNLEPKGVRDHS